MPTLAEFIYMSDDDILADTCWAIFYLIEESVDKIQTLLDKQICQRIIELLV